MTITTILAFIKDLGYVQKIGQCWKLPYEIMKNEHGDISFLFHKLTVHA